MIASSLVATSERFADWQPLLAAWVEQIINFCSHIDNDNPYWHGEQTNVAFLTGVAFRLPGWFSLTEFPSAKDSPELVNSYGRNDAWLKSPQSEYFIEAKQIYLELHQSNIIRDIQYIIAEAVKAALCICVEPLRSTPAANVHRVAVAFLCPCYIKQEKATVDDALRQLQRYTQDQPYDALAWVFPAQSYEFPSRGVSYYYPGVILLAKAIDLNNSPVAP